MLSIFLLIVFTSLPTSNLGLPIQEKHIWVRVSDGKKLLANVHIGTLEWTTTAMTDINGLARLSVSPQAQVGGPISITVLSNHFTTFDHRPFRTRIPSLNRPDQPIEMTVQRASNPLKFATNSKPNGGKLTTPPIQSSDPYVIGREALSEARFHEALENFTKAYNNQKEIYERSHTSSSKLLFSKVSFYLGLTLFELSRIDEARNKFELSSRLQKNWFEPNYFLAECSAMQGDYSKAEEAYKQALALPSARTNPLAAFAHIGLADINFIYGRLDVFHRHLKSTLPILENSPTSSRELSAIQRLEALIFNHLLKRSAYTDRRISRYVTSANLINNRAKLIFWEKEIGSNHPFLLLILNSLASNYMRRYQYERATKCYERALAICKQSYGEISIKYASQLLLMADLDKEEKRYNQAEEKCKKALEINQSLLGFQAPKIALIHYYIGGLFSRKEKYDQAKEQYQAALEITQKAHGLKHPLVIAIATDFAELENDQNNYSEAAALLEQALESAKTIWGIPDSEGLAVISEIIDKLISLYDKMGKSDQAQKAVEQKQILAKLGATPNSHHKDGGSLPIAGMNLRGSSLYYTDTSDPVEDAKCGPLLQQALRVIDLVIKKADTDVLEFLNAFSQFNYDAGKYNQAKVIIQRLLDASQNSIPPSPLSVASALNLRGLVMYSLGHYNEAEKDFRTALTIQELHIDKDSQDLVPALYNLGVVLVNRKIYKEARSLLERALSIREAEGSANADPDSIMIQWEIARMLCETSDHEEAEIRYKQIFGVMRNYLEDYALSTSFLEDYANCLRVMNRFEEAITIENIAKKLRKGK